MYVYVYIYIQFVISKVYNIYIYVYNIHISAEVVSKVYYGNEST